MNARARQLGLTNTHFENCRGTPRPGHLHGPRSGRAGPLRDARSHVPRLAGTSSAVITWPPDPAVTVDHNRLLEYPWADGVKTGATPESGMVLVGSGRPGLVPLLVVTMHEPNRDQEERDAVALFLWGSAQYLRPRRRLVAASPPRPSGSASAAP